MKSEVPDPNTVAWFENRFVSMADAKVSVLTHAFNYGTGVFEGIRGYYEQQKKELYLFRMLEHYERWKRNCRILRIKVPLSAENLAEITVELCRRNNFETHVYVRPLAYKASARLGVPMDDNDAYSITVIPVGEDLTERRGHTAGVSSWRRVEDNAIPGRAKVCGAYVNSVLAVDEARRNGYDEAIFLNENGHVAEGATSNLFMVRDGTLVTPPGTDNILEGLTRASIIELARRELALTVVERSIDRTELYVCDEVFLTGTAMEVTPIVQVDHRLVGAGQAGVVTQKLRTLYTEATRGRVPGYAHWVWPVYSVALAEKTA
jgi:branched-chain amino acid aminotransferase